MRSMIWHLIDALVEEEKKVQKKVSFNTISRERKKAGIFLVIAALFHLGAIIIQYKYGNMWVEVASLLILFISIIYFINNIRKEAQKEYRKNFEDYKNQLDILRRILDSKTFNLYTEKKIAKIIDSLNESIPTMATSQRVFKPTITYFSTFLPVTMFALGILINKTPPSVSFQILAFLIAGPIYFLGLYYFLKPVVKDYLDDELKTATRLKSMLSDILILDFTDVDNELIDNRNFAQIANIKKRILVLKKRKWNIL